jgi:hypothetical protein
MRKNIIILTSGLTGSSVLTGLIARAGYWTGDDTFKNSDYDTFENLRLIELNQKLLRDAGYGGNYFLEFSLALNDLAHLGQKAKLAEYREFIDHCNQHQPWVWKDPRLCLTIRFWSNLLDLENCRFIVLTRDLLQCWISTILRRRIMTYRDLRNYEIRIKHSIVDFLVHCELPYLQLQYEELILHPARAIDQLNRYLDTSLLVDDLKQVYHKPLYKNPRRSVLEHIKAIAIYVKNYSDRVDIAMERRKRQDNA